jgi:hypothetical protein
MKIRKTFKSIKYLIFLFMIFSISCSNIEKNPVSPLEKSTLQPQIRNKNNLQNFKIKKYDVKGDKLSNGLNISYDAADTSSQGSQQIGPYIGLYFNGIRDVTQPGGNPTMKFRAWTEAVDWAGVPIDIESISVEIHVRWKYVDSSGWQTLWTEKDSRQNSSIANVGWKSFYKKKPWTAQSYSMHEWKDGIYWGGAYNPPIEWTAYFVEGKKQ